MALLKNKPSDIPQGAVILSEDDAVKYQSNVLSKWKPQSDIWAIKYGGVALASLSAGTGIYLNNYFRRRFKLFHYGRMSSYLPVTVMPSLMSLILHTEFVLPSVILQKDCAVCTEIRASSLQAFMGMVFPTVLAPIASLALAVRYNTFNVPSITLEPMKVIELLKKQIKPKGNILFGLFMAHALAASFVTFLEAKAINRVHNKLIKMEYNLEHNGNDVF